ncbi:MAG: hypothetical protein CL908_14210 [Deltaproteobacteria bacterium]|nr:hypothetical protein [Deltaproteobacteria bacterium]
MKLDVFDIAPNPTRVRLYLAEKVAAGAENDVAQSTVSLSDGEQKLPEVSKWRFLCDNLERPFHPRASPREISRCRPLEMTLDDYLGISTRRTSPARQRG